MFKLGAVLVPLNPGFTVEQVVAAMQHLEATHFVVAEETCLGWRGKRRNAELVEGVRAEVGTLRGVVVVGRMDGAVGFGEVVRMGERHGGELVEGSPLLPDEVVNIQFTSGTTSTPKAACLTHRNILNNGMAIGNRMLLTPEDIVCCPPPLFQ